MTTSNQIDGYTTPPECGDYQNVNINDTTYQVQNLILKTQEDKVLLDMLVFEDSVDFRMEMPAINIPLSSSAITPIVLLEDVSILE